jgi:hypothetical protein
MKQKGENIVSTSYNGSPGPNKGAGISSGPDVAEHSA